MKRIILAFFGITAFLNVHSQFNDPFPLTDLHIHLKGDLTLEEAIKKSAQDQITYGLAVNCGLGFPVHKDSQIDSVLSVLRNYPQFYIGMQAEGREWVNIFSKESIGRFDYIFTDAMTFTDAKGRRNRIWIKEETWIDDEQEFMDYLVKTIEQILDNEPIHIYVNPTFLPQPMASRYDYFWTEERMDRVISAAKRNQIAIEINSRLKLPSPEFIAKAKEAGVKFTIGTNNTDKSFTRPDYAIEMINKLGLTADSFYLPEKGRQCQ
jgi:hypothetical protein